MNKHIMVGMDVHDENILMKYAVDREDPKLLSVKNSDGGRQRMIRILKKCAQDEGEAKVVFAYEASQLGFGLYDELTDARFEGYVLAPTKLSHSPKHRKQKTDEADAEDILEVIRGHILAGNKMPKIWIPDHQTRNDRELVRMRLTVGEKITSIKAQIKCLLKRNKLTKPGNTGQGWTKKYRDWLEVLTSDDSELPLGVKAALRSLLRQLKMLEQEVRSLDNDIIALSGTPRYAEPVKELIKIKGVGFLTAMVFLTELGDLRRFPNRQCLASYLGLIPSCRESGKRNDHKGHITHQGPARVRKMLCQTGWTIARCNPDEKVVYRRIVDKNPQHKKIGLVALMRRISIKMWHRGLEAQLRANCFQDAA